MNFNPYAQGGWANPQHQGCISNIPWSLSSPPQPSVYGALPFSYESHSSQDTMHRFGFKYDKTILKSIVFGPRDSRPYFRVAHDVPKYGMTTFTNVDGHNFAIIDWRKAPGPEVEMEGLLERLRVSCWMPLSADGMSRSMYARGKWFSWIPNQNCISLFVSTHGSMTPCLYAKIYRDSKLKAIILEVSTKAIQIGLVESCVVAAVLLQSGHNID